MGQHRLEAGVIGCSQRIGIFGWSPVVIMHLHAKGLGAFGNRNTNPAHAQYAKPHFCYIMAERCHD